MAQLQLSERELHVLRASLATALDGTCIPNWEFEALLGCSRKSAKRSLENGLRRVAARGERPSAFACELMVLLLSAVLGASQGRSCHELEALIELLTIPEHSPLESAVALRRDALPQPGRRVG